MSPSASASGSVWPSVSDSGLGSWEFEGLLVLSLTMPPTMAYSGPPSGPPGPPGSPFGPPDCGPGLEPPPVLVNNV